LGSPFGALEKIAELCWKIVGQLLSEESAAQCFRMFTLFIGFWLMRLIKLDDEYVNNSDLAMPPKKRKQLDLDERNFHEP
jgi:hypothetical protein